VSYIKKIGTTFLVKLLIAVLNLFILIITARELGAAVRGQISLLMVVLAAGVIIAELLSGPVLVYWTSRIKTRQLLQYAYGWISVVSLLMLLPVYWYDWFPGISALVLFSMLFFLSAAGAHGQILLGRGKVMLNNICGLIGPLYLFLVCVFGWRWGVFGFNDFVLHLGISYCLAWLFSGIFLMRTSDVSPVFYDGSLGLQSVARSGIFNQSSSLFTLAGSRLNFILLEASAGISAVGVFSSALAFSESVLIISGSISLVLIAGLVNQTLAEQNKKSILLQALISGLLTLSAMVILYLIPEEFFSALLSKDFRGVHALFLVLMPGIFCAGTGSVLTHYFSGNGWYHLNALISFCGLLVWAASSYFFAQSASPLMGAAYAFSLGWFFVMLLNFLVFFFRKTTRINF
jgi:O-antigen/teichoic acid export membrane protein